jgi:parallel beta-helix repeat protein
MKVGKFTWLIAAASILLSAPAPKAATTTTLTVQENGPTDATHFTTIQSAIAQARLNLIADAATTNTISVKAGTYVGPITPISKVSIIGESTGGTVITGSGTLINLDGVSDLAIRRFTFKSATVGIQLANKSANIDITNNVFLLTAGTAISVQSATASTITNNTFFNNQTAINAGSDITIDNNIFSNNKTAIVATSTLTQPTFNDFFQNTTNGVQLDANSLPNPKVTNDANPLFVKASLLSDGDFHLQPGSPAIGRGNAAKYPNSFDNTSSDMGAYGGPFSDNILAAITGVTSTATSPLTPPTTVTVSWNATNNGSVKGYRVYYGTSSGNFNGTQATEGNSPIAVPLGTTTQSLTFTTPLPPPVASLAAPVVTVSPLNNSLQVNWSAVAGATQYRIFHSTASFDNATLPATFDTVDAAATSFTIPGLINGTPYFVAVKAVGQARIFAAVTAVIDTTAPSNPGSSNESSFSAATSQDVGSPVEGSISTVVEDTPEAVVASPNLKSEGCFIATAAYGFYSAPQVQVLRDFRDRYLLTNAPGRAFVAWYYHYGPYAAHYINVHPWLKAPVRLALLPLVIGSFLLMNTTALGKLAILFALALSFLLYRKIQMRLLVHSGGTH